MWDACEGRASAAAACTSNGLQGPGRPRSARSGRLQPLARLLDHRRLRLPRPAARERSAAGTSSRDFCSGRIWRLKYDDGQVVRGRDALPRHEPQRHVVRRGRGRRALRRRTAAARSTGSSARRRAATSSSTAAGSSATPTAAASSTSRVTSRAPRFSTSSAISPRRPRPRAAAIRCPPRTISPAPPAPPGSGRASSSSPTTRG